MSGVTNTLLTSIFISFPEIVWILLFGFALMGMKVKMKNILFIAFFQTVVAFIVQALNIRFGLHSLVQSISTCLLAAIVLKIKILQAIVPVLIGISTQGVFQVMFLSLVIYFLPELDISQLRVNFIFTFIYHTPIIVLSIVVLYIVKKKNITII